MQIVITHRLTVGTYTETLPHVTGTAEGILGVEWFASGTAVGTVSRLRNPSWIEVSHSGDRIYSVLETGEFEGETSGGLAALSRDASTDELTVLNTRSSGGSFPAHLTLDASGRFLIVANYGGGSVVVVEVRPDGSLGALIDRVEHEGSGPHPIRQTSPHAHHVLFDPTSGRVLVVDLGIDAIMSYDLGDDGRLRPAGCVARMPGGSGPRHAVFHPVDHDVLYVVCELSSTVARLQRTGDEFFVAEVSQTTPADFDGENTAAAIRIDREGRNLYVTNRGHDSISVFRINSQERSLTLAQIEPVRGRTPRDCQLSTDGTRLYVANQDSNNIAVFLRSGSGEIEFDEIVDAPTPVCLVIEPVSAER